MNLHNYSNVEIFFAIQGVCFLVSFAFFFSVCCCLHWCKIFHMSQF